MNVAYNMDCLEAMREMQDNAFDLAVVDPPYGDALTDADGGGLCITDLADDSTNTKTLQELTDPDSMANRNITSGRIISPAAAGSCTPVKRTGGSWSAKYGKK